MVDVGWLLRFGRLTLMLVASLVAIRVLLDRDAPRQVRWVCLSVSLVTDSSVLRHD